MKPDQAKTETPAPVSSTPLFGVWAPAEQPARPVTYTPILIYGTLEGEGWKDRHKGFWCGRNWWSVRQRETYRMAKRRIDATHWMPMPPPPNKDSGFPPEITITIPAIMLWESARSHAMTPDDWPAAMNGL